MSTKWKTIVVKKVVERKIRAPKGFKLPRGYELVTDGVTTADIRVYHPSYLTWLPVDNEELGLPISLWQAYFARPKNAPYTQAQKPGFEERISRTQAEERMKNTVILGVEHPGCNVVRLLLGGNNRAKGFVIEIEAIREAGCNSLKFTRLGV